VINQQNKGVSEARNAGVNVATGRFVGFIDADDTIDADMYQFLLKNALDHKADISVCRIRVIYPHKTEEPKESPEIKVLAPDEALCRFFKGSLEESANNKIYLLSKIRDIKFEGRMNEDVLYNCRALLKADKIVVADAIKYNYLIRENSISMAGFNLKYLETAAIADKILKLVNKQSQGCIEHAKGFDIVVNISLLNLILLAGKEHYPNEYRQVAARLKAYAPFIRTSAIVRKKHKIAFNIFSISPQLYTWCLYAYGVVAKADLIHRTSTNQTQQKTAA
jgi:glycosyltransferase involved in cell wall biosynthesis